MEANPEENVANALRGFYTWPESKSLALEWPEVDFENSGIFVAKSISLTEGGQAVVEKTNTPESMDFVDMPTWYMEIMEEHLEAWKTEKEIAEEWLGGNFQYVFHGGTGRPYYFSTPSMTWRRFLGKHEFRPIRLHDLRHSAASLLLEEDVPLKVIQERLRHSKLETTGNIYAHLTKKVMKKPALKLDKFDPRKKMAPI